MKIFKPVFIEGYTLDDTWFQILNNIFNYGRKYKITSGSYKGDYRYSLDYIAGFIHQPRKQLVPYIPPNFGIPAPATEEEINNYFVNYLMNGVLAENEHYKYGTFIVGGYLRMPPIDHQTLKYVDGEDAKSILGRRIKVPNMVQWVIDHFKNHGYGNEHCYINIGYPELNLGYEISYKDESERLTSPCLRGIGFKIIKDEGEYYLLTDVYFRSWDAVGGFPINMGGITLLSEYVASHLEGVKPGGIAFASKGIHAYGFHYEYVKARLAKE